MKKFILTLSVVCLILSLTMGVSAASYDIESLIIRDDLKYSYMRTVEDGFILAYTNASGDSSGRTCVLLDSQGNQIEAPAGYEIVVDTTNRAIVSEGMVRIQKTINGETLYGFMNTKGELVVDAKYNEVAPFSNGFAAVYEYEKYDLELSPNWVVEAYKDHIGFVDRTGNLVIPMIYEQVGRFSEGRATVCKNKRWGVIDDNGNVIVPFQYTNSFSLGICSNGLMSFQSNGKYGYLDKAGKVKISAVYDAAGQFVDGFAVVSKNGFYGMIDTTGKTVIPFKYVRLGYFQEGMALYSDESGWNCKYGYINSKGEEVTPVMYNKAYDFSNGLAMVSVTDERFSDPVIQDRYGFIDKNGNEVIPLKYSSAESFVSGLALVRENSPDHIGSMGGSSVSARFDGKPKSIYIDTDGNEILSNNSKYWGIDFSGSIGVISRASGSYAIIKNPVYKEPPHAIGKFNDVMSDSYYAEPVSWAVENKVTSGTSTTTFSPSDICTNAQILTFLWRAKGFSIPTIQNPFDNVNGNEYYANASIWAYENGLVSGPSFSENIPCTRSMVVTYLWKLAGSPKSTSSSFSDIPADASYASAVSWAVSKGITNGTSATTFSPNDTCTRGQIVTFLYRSIGK